MIRLMPERPSTKARQVVSTSLPIGVRAPKPVTTTLVLFFDKGTPPSLFFTLFGKLSPLTHSELGVPMLTAWGSRLSPKVGRRDVHRLYNTKEAQEMRLALVEDRTSLFPTLLLGHDESKRPRCVFLTGEAFSYAGEAYGSFIAQALSLTVTLISTAILSHGTIDASISNKAVFKSRRRTLRFSINCSLCFAALPSADATPTESCIILS